ncbi:MAG: hypothetical protein EHM91_15850, partial [Planctomycetota bacterium]
MNYSARFCSFFAGAVAAVCLFASCAPPGQAVGDSISVGIAATAAVHIDASGGRTTYSAGYGPGTGSGLDAVRRLAPKVKVHGWVIIELGTNDVAVQADTPGQYLSRISQLTNAVPADRCVAFVTVKRPTYAARAQSWNTSVRAVLKQRPCWRVIEWAAAATAFPSYTTADGFHPSETGKRYL